jgi:tetratricopeptide (TPR) repeat protein
MAKKNKKTPKKDLIFENRKLWLLAVCVISIIAFSSNFKGEILTFDDNQYFEDYPDIVDLKWENVKRYFTEKYVIMYHPLPILSFAVQYDMHKLNPLPYHLFNFFFHLINILLAYLLAKTISRKTLVGLIVALVFAIHPMNTEAVSWISARSSVMYSCFFMASLLVYWRYITEAQKHNIKWLGLAFFLATLSFFSKANALPLPIVLLLFDWYAKRKFSAKLLLEKLPFFALSVVFGLIALNDSGTQENLNIGTSEFNLIDGLLLSIYSVGNYVIQFFAPFHLSAIHVYPVKDGGSLPILYYVAPVIFAIAAFLVYKIKHNRALLFGLGFFALIVSVTLQIVPSRLFMMADRYVYLPYVGFAFIIATYISNLRESKNVKEQKRSSSLLTAVVVWSLILSVITFSRNKVWNTTESLVTDIIKKNNEHEYLARAYGIRAAIKEGNRDSRSALADLNKAIELRSDEGESYYNRGQIYFRLLQYEKARSDFKKAEELLGMHFTLANYLGGCEYNLNNYVSSLEYYNQAVELKPDYAEAIRNRGSVYASILEYDNALKDYNRAVKLVPNDPDAYKFRGFVYLKLNNREKACSDLLRAEQLGAQGVEQFITANNCANN